jgi:hypothetical protein
MMPVPLPPITGSPGDLKVILKTSMEKLKEIEGETKIFVGHFRINQYTLVRANALITIEALNRWMEMSDRLVSKVMKMERH